MRRVGVGPEAPPQTLSITILNISWMSKICYAEHFSIGINQKHIFFSPQMNGEKSPNSGIFVSPGSFLWKNISLLIHVCSYNGFESLRSFLLRVLLMYSQYTWKVHTNYIQLKGFQNVSPKALPFSSKFPDELPRGWLFNRSKQPPLGNGFPTKVGNVKGCEVMALVPQMPCGEHKQSLPQGTRDHPPSTLCFPDRLFLCFHCLCWAVLTSEVLGLLIWSFYWSQQMHLACSSLVPLQCLMEFTLSFAEPLLLLLFF